jgi:hypothetical protein
MRGREIDDMKAHRRGYSTFSSSSMGSSRRGSSPEHPRRIKELFNRAGRRAAVTFTHRERSAFLASVLVLVLVPGMEILVFKYSARPVRHIGVLDPIEVYRTL